MAEKSMETNTLLQTNKSMKGFWLWGALLMLGTLAYGSLYLFNMYPTTEGWGVYYVELISRGQIPYRDFYYYLPPLALLIDGIFWKLSFGSLLMFRIWYILQRLVIVGMLYKLVTRWIRPQFAFIAVLTALCLRSAVVWDLGGDYNQTQTLFLLLLTYIIVWFLEREADSQNKGIRRYLYIGAAGFVIALMVLLKQSAGLAALLGCFLFLVAYCIVFKDKRFWLYCLATAAGALLPLLAFLVYLLVNGAFFPFLEQFFGGANAKGGMGTILFGGVVEILTRWSHILAFGAALLVCWSFVNAANKKQSVWILAAHILVAVLAVWFAFQGNIQSLMGYVKSFGTLKLALLGTGLICLGFCLYFWKLGKQQYLPGACALVTAVLFAGLIFGAHLDPFDLITAIYYNTEAFYDIPAVMTYGSIYTMVIMLVIGFARYVKTGTLPYPKAVLFVLTGALIDAYMNMINSARSVFPIAGFIPAAMVLAVLFSAKLVRWNAAKNIAVCMLCLIICGAAMTQKTGTGYSWWGAEDTYSITNRTEPVGVKGLEGLRLAPQKALELREITRVVAENADADDRVVGFPHVKIFNVLTDHYNLGEPVPVPFYDVCSDEAAFREAQWLRETMPEIIIWCDMPYCVEVHEDVFRGGKPLGQREIIRWFIEEKGDHYQKIGQAGNLHVYKLKDGSPIHYTFIQDHNNPNITAGEK